MTIRTNGNITLKIDRYPLHKILWRLILNVFRGKNGIPPLSIYQNQLVHLLLPVENFTPKGFSGWFCRTINRKHLSFDGNKFRLKLCVEYYFGWYALTAISLATSKEIDLFVLTNKLKLPLLVYR